MGNLMLTEITVADFVAVSLLVFIFCFIIVKFIEFSAVFIIDAFSSFKKRFSHRESIPIEEPAVSFSQYKAENVKYFPLNTFPGLYMTNCCDCGVAFVVSIPDDISADDDSLCYSCSCKYEECQKCD